MDEVPESTMCVLELVIVDIQGTVILEIKLMTQRCNADTADHVVRLFQATGTVSAACKRFQRTRSLSGGRLAEGESIAFTTAFGLIKNISLDNQASSDITQRL